ncbi:MAG: DUF177 domain-containing protein [Bacteroidales bacterium]|nr:DUF177 domain-containing protein [Bacteroidales bacterium]
MKTKEKKDEFKIRIAGVEIGKYSYSMTCDKEFFEISELSDLQDGCLNLRVEMDKSEKMLDLKFHFQGEVEALCDRCLDPVRFEMDFSEHLVVNLVPEVEDDFENDDNIWMVDENIYELDLFHFVYESICLALPHRIVHPNDENGNSTCNPEVLKRLEAMSHRESTHEVDDRWAALKDLKLD